MAIGQMTQKAEKVYHSAYRKSVGEMVYRREAKDCRQNEMSPSLRLRLRNTGVKMYMFVSLYSIRSTLGHYLKRHDLRVVGTG
jgi:hypothetical protein